eukprot:PLAT3160.1.p1 GENE.PLAT3160.1~~PLAT3160.1.p1  ORF type:complete len:731 (+),score=470.45 PLAT3160.1:252-2444(+)
MRSILVVCALLAVASGVAASSLRGGAVLSAEAAAEKRTLSLATVQEMVADGAPAAELLKVLDQLEEEILGERKDGLRDHRLADSECEAEEGRLLSKSNALTKAAAELKTRVEQTEEARTGKLEKHAQWKSRRDATADELKAKREERAAGSAAHDKELAPLSSERKEVEDVLAVVEALQKKLNNSASLLSNEEGGALLQVGVAARRRVGAAMQRALAAAVASKDVNSLRTLLGLLSDRLRESLQRLTETADAAKAAWQKADGLLGEQEEELVELQDTQDSTLSTLSSEASELLEAREKLEQDHTSTLKLRDTTKAEHDAKSAACARGRASWDANLKLLNEQLDSVAALRAFVKEKLGVALDKDHLKDAVRLDAQWNAGEWGECNAKCGGGVAERAVTCVSVSEGKPLAPSSCAGLGDKPSTQRDCNEDACVEAPAAVAGTQVRSQVLAPTDGAADCTEAAALAAVSPESAAIIATVRVQPPFGGEPHSPDALLVGALGNKPTVCAQRAPWSASDGRDGKVVDVYALPLQDSSVSMDKGEGVQAASGLLSDAAEPTTCNEIRFNGAFTDVPQLLLTASAKGAVSANSADGDAPLAAVRDVSASGFKLCVSSAAAALANEGGKLAAFAGDVRYSYIAWTAGSMATQAGTAVIAQPSADKPTSCVEIETDAFLKPPTVLLSSASDDASGEPMALWVESVADDHFRACTAYVRKDAKPTGSAVSRISWIALPASK